MNKVSAALGHFLLFSYPYYEAFFGFRAGLHRLSDIQNSQLILPRARNRIVA
jgi:hypothetical protein